MDMIEDVCPALKTYRGSAVIEASENQSLKIKVTGQGEHIVDSAVPAGKAWMITLSLAIEETDA